MYLACGIVVLVDSARRMQMLVNSPISAIEGYKCTKA
jgi:hypothetical protein